MHWIHPAIPPSIPYAPNWKKMEPTLAEQGYVGYIDINCIANARGIYPLEFTARFGYPTISVQIEGVTGNWGEFFFAIAKGEQCELKTKRGFQIGVICSVPPFPYDDKSAMAIYQGLSILFKKENIEGVRLGDVRMDEGDWRVAGERGYVLVVMGAGATVEEARKQAYSRVDNIMLQNMFYRTDVGAKWSEDSDKLQTWGYLY